MQVAQYTFQSPSTSQVQVGRLDPSSVKAEKTPSFPSAVSNPTQAEAQSFSATQTQVVKPTVSANSIDVYA